MSAPHAHKTIARSHVKRSQPRAQESRPPGRPAQSVTCMRDALGSTAVVGRPIRTHAGEITSRGYLRPCKNGSEVCRLLKGHEGQRPSRWRPMTSSAVRKNSDTAPSTVSLAAAVLDGRPGPDWHSVSHRCRFWSMVKSAPMREKASGYSCRMVRSSCAEFQTMASVCSIWHRTSSKGSTGWLGNCWRRMACSCRKVLRVSSLSLSYSWSDFCCAALVKCSCCASAAACGESGSWKGSMLTRREPSW
mmetsp:Transcript_20480/g.68760  ORF Transcript_20480/g.68760 Transcript_20480/m.68760 type:complete len:247 (-) Transcript_20480:870-1610(-)